VAAVAVLAGGAAVGLLASRRRFDRIVPFVTAGVAIGCAVPVALASRRPPISPEAAAEALRTATARPTFTVLVGARDEAGVLPQLVGEVAAQDYRGPDGEPLFEVVVVDDRSVDGTGEVVLRAARECGIERITRVIRREGESCPDGKGAALTAAQPRDCRGDIVVVLDADARIRPDFLTRAAGYFAAGAQAVTARRRILDSDAGALAGAQLDEQTLDGELNRGRWALGGCSEFRGNGIMVRRSLLEAVGGWRPGALAEDLDLSSRLAADAGVRVAWALDVEVWEEPVRDWGGLWRQRQRWAEGAFRRAFEHGPGVMASSKLSVGSKLDFAAYVGQLAVPAVGVGAAASAIATGRKRAPAAIFAGYMGVGAALGWDSLRWERHPDGSPLATGERARRAIRVALFNALWLPVVPVALLRLALRSGPVRYEKMEHTGGVSGNEPKRGFAP